MTLGSINQMNIDDARNTFMQCCTSSEWVDEMINARPFIDRNELTSNAEIIWKNLEQADYLQAFEGHPKIGDLESLADKYADTIALAGAEQESVNLASDSVIEKLSVANNDYYNKFGFIFIVCASGKTAEEMLSLLLERLTNDRPTEIVNAAEEQRKIFLIRLNKLLGE